MESILLHRLAELANMSPNPGEILVVNGATGRFGSARVMVASRSAHARCERELRSRAPAREAIADLSSVGGELARTKQTSRRRRRR